MPPPGWTIPESGAKATSPLDLSHLGKSKYFHTHAVDNATHTCCVVGVGATHSIGLPIHVYPLYENAFRAHRNQSIKQNHEESAQLYADFAKVAEQNEFAWFYGQEAPTAEVIANVTEKNRIICFPCILSLYRDSLFRGKVLI